MRPFPHLTATLLLFIGGAARAECDMPMRAIDGPPSAQLAAAEKDLHAGRTSSAYREADAVLGQTAATDAQRAEAHAIEGWVDWRNGLKPAALDQLAKAKALDPGAVAPVLALAPDSKAKEELRKEL